MVEFVGIPTYLGNRMQKNKWGRKMKCIICEKVSDIKKGHNPEPVKRFKDGTCCDDCQYEFVLPARGIPYETSMKIKESL